jgi:hypothetical protein
MIVGDRQRHRDLTIVRFAEPSAILSRHAHQQMMEHIAASSALDDAQLAGKWTGGHTPTTSARYQINFSYG